MLPPMNGYADCDHGDECGSKCSFRCKVSSFSVYFIFDQLKVQLTKSLTESFFNIFRKASVSTYQANPKRNPTIENVFPTAHGQVKHLNA